MRRLRRASDLGRLRPDRCLEFKGRLDFQVKIRGNRVDVAEVETALLEMSAVEWRFSGTALRRTRLALRLERDLELNLAGVALALDLMEEVERLRQALRARR